MRDLPSFRALLFGPGVANCAAVGAEVGSMVSKVRLLDASDGVKPV